MFRITLFTLLIAMQTGTATAEKRVAFVVGNAKYAYAAELTNPVNDATDMAAALKALGFTVVDGYNLTKPMLERKIRDFAVQLSGADAGVFFYAGHGVQVSGVNYIVPVDAELTTADALDFEMVRLDAVQRAMEASAKTNILFLDACRNNPLARNLARALGTRAAGIGRGLAPAESGIGTLISFSTQPGNVAQDGAGRNSPYTGPLVKRLGTAGEDVRSILTAVRNDVLSATANSQVPWENNALLARFYFSQPKDFSQEPKAAVPQLSPEAQVWDLNGSIMFLHIEGNQRSFVYKDPRSELAPWGIKTGSLNFRGRLNGNTLSGYGYVYSRKCGGQRYEFPVNGELDNDRVSLVGQAPDAFDDDCKPIRYRRDESNYRRIK